MKQTWQEVLMTSKGVDGAALNTSAADTSIIPVGSVYTLPTNFFEEAGKRIRIELSGRISVDETTSPQLTLSVRLGATVVTGFDAVDLHATVAKTDVPWTAWIELEQRAIGEVATLFGVGEFKSEAIIASPLPAAGGIPTLHLSATPPAVGNTFDATATQAVNVFAQWSDADAGNSIQVHMYKLVSLN